MLTGAHLTLTTVHRPAASYVMITLSILAPSPPPGYSAMLVQTTRAWSWN